MPVFSAREFPILFCERWTTDGLADSIRKIDVVALCREYEELRKAAPSRCARNKRYFVGHDGCPQAKDRSNVSEKHLAIALWNHKAQWSRSGGGWMRLLDYEVPLKASNSDKGLGDVDLLGITEQGRLVVVELKVRRKNGARGDTPLLALMEGLRYAAVVLANHPTISAEAADCFGIKTTNEPPIVQILAPGDWWNGWHDMNPSTRKRAGPWEREFVKLSGQLKDQLGIIVECTALQRASLADVTWHVHRPRLRNTTTMHRIELMD